MLLYGPPGTGKTLLARAVAHHTECTFIRVSGSELVQKFIGEGARMVRELFVMAREHAPSIIFMDEIDSIGSSRVEGSHGGNFHENFLHCLKNKFAKLKFLVVGFCEGHCSVILSLMVLAYFR